MSNAVQSELLLNGITDTNGKPLSGGKVYTYAAGTVTDKICWTDRLKTSPDTNPVILDSAGKKLIFCEGIYKFVIKNSSDQTLYTYDNLYLSAEPDVITVYSSAYTNLSNAIAAAAGKELVLNASIPLISNITSMGSVGSIRPQSPGVIVSAGYTINIDCPVVGNPMHQWLSGFAAGEVTFGAGSIQEFHPIWVGGSPSASASVNATALAIAMNVAQSVPRIPISLESGQYTFNGAGLTIAVPQAVIIRGKAGAFVPNPSTAVLERATVLLYTGTSTALTLDGALHGLELSNFILRGTSAAADGIYLRGAGATFRNITVQGFAGSDKAGLHIIASQVNNYYNCSFLANYYGVLIEGNSSETTTQTFYNPVFHSNLKHGYHDTGSFRTVLNNIVGQSNEGSTIFVDYQESLFNGSLLHINGAYLSQNNNSLTGYDIDIRGLSGTATVWARNTKIENIHFGSRGAAQLGEVRLRNTRQTMLENFKFAVATAPNIVASNGDNIALLTSNIDNGLGDNMMQDGSGNTVYWPQILGGDAGVYLSIRGKLLIGQYDTTGGIEALKIQQDDVDVGFIDLAGTSEAGSSKNITTWTVGATLTGYVKMEINGTAYWMPYYTAPTS